MNFDYTYLGKLKSIIKSLGTPQNRRTLQVLSPLNKNYNNMYRHIPGTLSHASEYMYEITYNLTYT